MSDMYAVPKEKLDAIADAINIKRDTVGGMSIDDMPLNIGLIEGSGGGTVVSGSFTLDENTTEYNVIADIGFIPDFIHVSKSNSKLTYGSEEIYSLTLINDIQYATCEISKSIRIRFFNTFFDVTENGFRIDTASTGYLKDTTYDWIAVKL